MSATKLTEKQQYWLEHVEQAQSQGLSMSAYAKQHDLNLKLFYNMRTIFRQKGVLPQATDNGLMIPVSPPQLQHESIGCRVCLPNGVVIELSDIGRESELAELLSSASQL